MRPDLFEKIQSQLFKDFNHDCRIQVSPLAPLSGQALQWQLWEMQTGACSSRVIHVGSDTNANTCPRQHSSHFRSASISRDPQHLSRGNLQFRVYLEKRE